LANILALVPIKECLPPALRERALELLNRLEVQACAIGDHRVETHARMCAADGDEQPYSAHAQVRNKMLDWCLTDDHTHVLWIDADVVDYPANLASLLIERDSEGIIAPVPLIEGSDRFYDVYGFVKMDGSRVEKPYPPYPNGEMMSVGTCYMAPASLYHAGARYATTPGHTEHYSVCRKAARVGVTSDVVVYHANLPTWGLKWNTL
jgi:hypothetical protein